MFMRCRRELVADLVLVAVLRACLLTFRLGLRSLTTSLFKFTCKITGYQGRIAQFDGSKDAASTLKLRSYLRLTSHGEERLRFIAKAEGGLQQRALSDLTVAVA